MKKISIAILGIFALGFLVCATPIAQATGFEDNLSSMVQDIRDRVTQIQDVLRNLGAAERFDTIDSKLDRIYNVCNRSTGTTATRTTVTSAQATSCVNNCFASTALERGPSGALNNPRFVACVSRCPSNTLRNIECAQRYVNVTSYYETVPVNPGQQEAQYYVHASHSPEGLFGLCQNRYQITTPAQCRQFGDVLVSTLASCLIDQRQLTCQSDCDATYQNLPGYLMCLNRCNGNARSSAVFQQMREAGLINELGRLSVTAAGASAGAGPISSTTPTVNPTTPGTGLPSSLMAPSPLAGETYPQCVYRCDAERLNCIKGAKVDTLSSCEMGYTTCYAACNAKR